MRNTWKVAKWEIKRNMRNKSFIISLLLTPILFAFFFFVPSLFSGSDSEDMVQVYVLDELNAFGQIKQIASAQELKHWHLVKTTKNEETVRKQVAESDEQAVFIPLTEKAIDQAYVPIYMNDHVPEEFMYEASLIETVLRQLQIERIGLTDEQKMVISQGVTMEPVVEETSANEDAMEADDPLKRAVPGIFSGVILFSIVMTGMMIFTSASQEKKEKVAEIILSSVTPGDLMQGKIIGYFVLGITQVAVWIVFAIPLVIWKFDIPLLKYLFVPELLLLLFIAVAGYLLFAAIFVGIGATVEDMTATSNFQGMVMMLPFLPLIFIGPILDDPSGSFATIGSFIPFTAPGVLLMRLSLLESWPWMEIVLALIILVASIWLMMKLAGKVFKVGILMYGKNATPKEIWKWMWT
ncbi:ABC transporter permease [Siminovitchia sp. 179-K 8D1 HS]|uniref:ABC transporter permease n=1 Tax=Siminovitchia sp. 179-K 8D1 HS TaxID=3142385 RepID=UPI0039A0FD58